MPDFEQPKIQITPTNCARRINEMAAYALSTLAPPDHWNRAKRAEFIKQTASCLTHASKKYMEQLLADF